MNVITVTDFKKVDTTRYKAGQVFTTGKQLGILHQGTIEPLILQKDLKEYVKKKDVQKLIDDKLKDVK